MIKIKNRYTNAVILKGEYETLVELINANSGANMRYADLSSADLSYANLSSANLRYANLRYANLSYANLSYADLSSADLSSANLRSADLSYANLSSANLRSANLRYANLSSANLRYAHSTDLIIKNIYSIGPIGSRQDVLQIWCFADGSQQYKTGCFSGTKLEFEAAVNQHSMPKHRADYLAAITFIDTLEATP